MMINDSVIISIANSLSVESGFVKSKLEPFLDKSASLSYSKLKHMTSPMNFVKNLISPDMPNVGMSFGSLVDLLMTNEDRFDDKYKINDISPSPGNQTDLVEQVLKGDKSIPIVLRFKSAFESIYKRGKVEDYAAILLYCKNIESGITLITQKQYNEAKIVSDNLRSKPEIEDILSQADGLQKYLEFEYRGWKFRSILDILSLDIFYDLKFVKNLNPDVFQRDVEKFGYDLQFGLYNIALKTLGLHTHKTCGKFIAYDNAGNYSIMKFGDDYMNYAEKKVDVYLNRLERIIQENAWNRSYDFFTPNRVITKPGFIKGFSELDLLVA